MNLKYCRRVFFGLIIVILIFIFTFQESVTIAENDLIENFLSLSYPLKNILSDEANLNVSATRQIFLLETHMNKERYLENPRQACTVESAGLEIIL